MNEKGISGRRAALHLAGLRVAVVIAAAAALAGCGPEPGPPETQPNVILVTIDTLRADRVGERPDAGPVMPSVVEMGRAGALFDYAVSPMGTTWPSHATMLTGLYPRYHGLRSNGHTLPEDVPVIAELLRNGGYRTASFVSFKGMHYVGGLDRGFDTISDPERPPKGVGVIRNGRETLDMALEWLQGLEPTDEPVFLWLHLFEPHSPYDLTDYSRRWIEETGYSGMLADGADRGTLTGRRLDIVGDPAELEALNVLYDGEARLADDYFRELLDALDDRGLLEDSLVVFTSDHGDSLGEDGAIGHGPILRQEVLDVPLVIRDFRIDVPPRRIERAVGLVDLAPTIAEIALKIPLPDAQGRSLVPFIYGDPDEVGASPEYFAEVALRTPGQVGTWYHRDAIMVYSQGLEFIFHGDDPARVLLPSDRAGTGSGIVPSSQVDEALASYIEDLVVSYLAGEVQPEEADLDESDIEALRALGYLQ